VRPAVATVARFEMNISSRTPEGLPERCPVCGKSIRVEPSLPPGDAPCPNCGSLLWFAETVLGDESELLVQDAIVANLPATSKPDAIHEIVANLAAAGTVDREHVASIAQAILQREELGSTGIGKGFAVPHAEHASVDHLVGTMAFSRNGIDFEAVDGRPVHTIFLFVSPPGRRNDYLRALERVSRFA